MSAFVARVPAVDILVNNLGVVAVVSFERITDDAWFAIYEANVMSGVRLTRAYLPGMRAVDWGRVVFISSESAQQIPAEMIHYGVTKTALVAFVSTPAASAITGALRVDAGVLRSIFELDRLATTARYRPVRDAARATL